MITITCRISWMSPVRTERASEVFSTLTSWSEEAHPAVPRAARSSGRRASRLSRTASAERRMEGEDEGLPGLAVEVEVVREVAQHRRILSHIRPRVGTTVGAGVDPLVVQEVVLDELEVRVLAQHLVVDEALLG